MILSQKAIAQAQQMGQLKITPYFDGQVDKAHVVLHLGASGLQDGTLVVAAKGFALAETKEIISLSDDLCGFIEGRASLAKQGISIESHQHS